MKRTITIYLISIIILVILVSLSHLYNWPGTKFSVLLGIITLIIVGIISIVRSKKKRIALLFTVLSVPLFIFSTGLSLNQFSIRYSIWLFGERFPSSIKTNLSSDNCYPKTDQKRLIAEFENVIKEANDQWFTRSFILIKNNEVVLEEYFNGTTPNDAFNLKSATKSITSALIGIAIDKGLIKSEDQQLIDFFPEYFENDLNSDKKEITIRNLLTMQSGFSFYDRNMTGLNWTSSIIEFPLTHKIGDKFCYSDCQSQLLVAIIERATKMTIDEFAQRNLFMPIDASIGFWAKSPDGINRGYSDLYLTSIDMAKFGNLILKDGKINNNEVISENWIRQSLMDYSSTKERCDQIQFDSYGFNWWKKNILDYEVYSAVGWGGQMIMIVPELDVVIVNVNEPNVSAYDCGVNTDMSLGYIEEIIKIFQNENKTSAHNTSSKNIAALRDSNVF